MPKGKYIRTKEIKLKNSQANLNQIPWNKDRTNIYSEKTIQKMQNSHKGKNSPLKGKTYEEVYGVKKANKIKNNISKNHRNINGKNNPNFKKDLSKERNPAWKGGLSYEPYSIDWTSTLKRSIRERDHYTCKICGNLQSEEVFSVHHIDYNKQNCNPNNLITLCPSCHSKTNFNRNFWISYFNNLINLI